jgi:hypothetical protein
MPYATQAHTRDATQLQAIFYENVTVILIGCERNWVERVWVEHE